MERGELYAMTDLQMSTPEWLVPVSVSGDFKIFNNCIRMSPQIEVLVYNWPPRGKFLLDIVVILVKCSLDWIRLEVAHGPSSFVYKRMENRGILRELAWHLTINNYCSPTCSKLANVLLNCLQ